MKVRDFIKRNDDIDVYDDVCEALGIAFCGPLKLKKAGLAEFSDVLDYDIDDRGDLAIVHVDDPDDAVWKHRLKRAKKFFHAAAGYCSDDDWDKWFVADDIL